MKKNLKDLAQTLAEEQGIQRAEAERTISTVRDLFTNELEKGNQVAVRGLGTFTTKRLPPRRINDLEGNVVRTGPRKKVVLKASRSLERRLTHDDEESFEGIKDLFRTKKKPPQKSSASTRKKKGTDPNKDTE